MSHQTNGEYPSSAWRGFGLTSRKRLAMPGSRFRALNRSLLSVDVAARSCTPLPHETGLLPDGFGRHTSTGSYVFVECKILISVKMRDAQQPISSWLNGCFDLIIAATRSATCINANDCQSLPMMAKISQLVKSAATWHEGHTLSSP